MCVCVSIKYLQKRSQKFTSLFGAFSFPEFCRANQLTVCEMISVFVVSPAITIMFVTD